MQDNLDLNIRVSCNGSLRVPTNIAMTGEVTFHGSHKFWNYGSSFPHYLDHTEAVFFSTNVTQHILNNNNAVSFHLRYNK